MNEAQRIIGICYDQLVEIGETRIANQISNLGNDVEPIILKGSYAASGLRGHEPVGRIRGACPIATTGRIDAEDAATKDLIDRAKAKGVKYLCCFSLVHCMPYGHRSDDRWNVLVTADGFA